MERTLPFCRVPRFTDKETVIPKVEGTLKGLKPSQTEALNRLYKRRFPTEAIYTPAQAQELALLSRSLNRQLALLIDRRGKVITVIAGSAERIVIPELDGKSGQGRLKGLRLLHTHLAEEGVSEEDLMDLLFLRLDVMAVLTVTDEGRPSSWQYAQLNPKKADNPYTLSPLLPWDVQESLLASQTQHIEADFSRLESGKAVENIQRAILVSVADAPKLLQEKNLEELASLCATAGVRAEGSMIQRSRVNPRFILGKGKIAELEVLALQHNADTLIFDGELTPAQLHNLADITERRVLDRTQLILDIFAQHAKSKAGKLQVELAQLRYLQPRLVGKNKAMDRLMGGIGGRGPGETRLETDRRRNKERMAFLRKELAEISRQRSYVRSRRKRNGLPLVALVGYTNAGKSTLLNTLSRSSTLTADKLFATLDPVSRRLRFPKAGDIIVADTIGFIRNLPEELLDAFQATLEELYDADLLLHVVDAKSEDFVQHIQSVRDILCDLNLTSIPSLLVFNKWDCLSESSKASRRAGYPEAIPVSAEKGEGLETLQDIVLSTIEENFSSEKSV